MAATALIWIETINLEKDVVAELTHQGVKLQFTFGQARKLIIGNLNKSQVLDRPKNEPKINKNSWLQMIVELAA